MTSKTAKILGIVGLAGVAYLIFSKFSLSQSVSFRLKAVSLSGSPINPVAQIIFSAYNPTNTSAVLKSLSGSLSYLGSASDPQQIFLGNVYFTSPATIAPIGNTDIPVNVEISDIGILQSLVAFVQDPGTIFNFNGIASVDGINIPLNINYNI
jgi:hypothetical protein